MKRIILIIGLTFLMNHACQSHAGVPQSQNLVLEGIVKKIGVAQGASSGVLAVYQFAEYKVTSVCEGRYDQKEIVIDHLILEGNELDGLRPGDKVRLVIRKSNTIFTRNNESGFRNAEDKVEVFYIGEKPQILSPNCAPCEPCREV